MKIKVLCVAIIFHLWSNEILADDFNYSFIRGGSKEVPEVLKNPGQNIPGKYVVDLLFNGSKTATSVDLAISNDDAEHICLSDEWLQEKGITINKEFYKAYLNPARNCYIIDKEKNSRVFFDPSLQELSIDMPQAGFIDTKKKAAPGIMVVPVLNSLMILILQNQATRTEPLTVTLKVRSILANGSYLAGDTRIKGKNFRAITCC